MLILLDFSRYLVIIKIKNILIKESQIVTKLQRYLQSIYQK